MKSLMRRSKKLKVRRRTAIKNQKDLERTWTQQRTARENPGIFVQL